MKKQIIMATISFYSFTLAMDNTERKPEAKVYFEDLQAEQKIKQQPNPLDRYINAHEPQSLENRQNISNQSFSNQSSLFVMHRTNQSAKL